LRTSQGDYSIFFGSTVSLVIVAIIVLSLAGPLVWRILRRKSPAAEGARDAR
jgi:TctA family transporter